MISPALSTPSQLEETAEALRAWIAEQEASAFDAEVCDEDE